MGGGLVREGGVVQKTVGEGSYGMASALPEFSTLLPILVCMGDT